VQEKGKREPYLFCRIQDFLAAEAKTVTTKDDGVIECQGSTNDKHFTGHFLLIYENFAIFQFDCNVLLYSPQRAMANSPFDRVSKEREFEKK
jgi:hypothetical protein